MLQVPKGSLIEIYCKDSKPQQFTKKFNGGEGIRLILNEDLSFGTNSSFGPVFEMPDSPISGLFTMVAQISRSNLNELKTRDESTYEWNDWITRGASTFGQYMSGQYREFGFQIWKRTDPLNITISFKLYATYNAKFQVVDPVVYLMKIPLPARLSFVDSKATKDGLEIMGAKLDPLIPPGPPLKAVFPKMKGYSDFDRYFDFKIGNTWFPDVFIKNVNVTFSKEQMEVNGILYPMSADVKVDISSVFIMTQDYVQNSMMTFGNDITYETKIKNGKKITKKVIT